MQKLSDGKIKKKKKYSSRTKIRNKNQIELGHIPEKLETLNRFKLHILEFSE